MSWGVFIPQQSLAASAGRGCRLVVEEVAGAGAGGVGWGRAGGKPTAPPPEAHDRRRVAQLDARAVVAVHSVRVNKRWRAPLPSPVGNSARLGGTVQRSPR